MSASRSPGNSMGLGPRSAIRLRSPQITSWLSRRRGFTDRPEAPRRSDEADEHRGRERDIAADRSQETEGIDTLAAHDQDDVSDRHDDHPDGHERHPLA